MRIAFDVSFMTRNNQGGGVFQYAHRLVTSLATHTDHTLIALVFPGEDHQFANIARDNFQVISLDNRLSISEIVRREGIEVIHTPIQCHQNFTLAVPMINSLHDLQPFYYPEFFTPEEIEYRNIYYRKSAEFSERVIVSYQHVKDDLTKFYGIPPEKIDICSQGMTGAEEIPPSLIDTVRRKYDLPESYLLYSANTWRHKNHIGLLRALKILHDRYGLKTPLICTGFQYPDFFPQLEEEIRNLGLTDSVRFLGYLPEEEMPAILCGSTLSVIPTLYEAGSFPLMEAMNHGVPVICSTTTSLPDTIGDLRFVFDPNSPEEMAGKMAMMLTDEQMRQENIANSAARVAEWRWEKAVHPFLESYQKAIDSFATKKKSRWYNDWAVNYEFMALRVESKLRRELGIYSDEMARARAAADQQTSHAAHDLNAVRSSLSWRLTAPIRKLADLVRKAGS